MTSKKTNGLWRIEYENPQVDHVETENTSRFAGIARQ